MNMACRFAIVSIAFMALGAIEGIAQDKAKEKIETIKIVYRCQFDAVAPRTFHLENRVVIGGLKIKWDIPEKEKKALDELLADFDKRKVNGAEFECKGEWLKKDVELRVTTTPKLTEKGRLRIKMSER